MGRKSSAEAVTLYSTGISGIDNQHNEIIFMLDALHDHLGKKDLSEEDIIVSMEEILVSLESHFSTELNLLEMIDFSGTKEHKKEHKKLNDRFLRKLKDLKKNEKATAGRFIISFRNTLMDHIANCDRVYVENIENIIALRKKFKITATKARKLVD
jgi:hemerythrin-like metal-binding protein